MPLIGGDNLNLKDTVGRLDSAGQVITNIAEFLHQQHEFLQFQTWKATNEVAAEKALVRIGLPSVGFKQVQGGSRPSKSTTATIEDTVACIEGISEVNRDVANMGGNIEAQRMIEARAFLESMSQTYARAFFYGNSSLFPEEFTGIATRYGQLSTTPGSYGAQVIDCGGTANRRSLWLINFSETTITGIYPKNFAGGLRHFDATANLRPADDGRPVGDRKVLPNGNIEFVYTDVFQWWCGIHVRDHRHAVRAANIDIAALLADPFASGALDIEDLMIRMEERIDSSALSSGGLCFIAPRAIYEIMRRQATRTKRGFLDWEMFGGRRMRTFNGIPICRSDALNVNEAAVV